MLTKDLIAALQKCDPTGELHVCVGNSDILFVDTEPAYYDGRQQVLIRDPALEGKCYPVIGVEFRSSGIKVVIHSHSVWNAIDDNPEVPVTYNGSEELYQERVEERRKKIREINAKFARDTAAA